MKPTLAVKIVLIILVVECLALTCLSYVFVYYGKRLVFREIEERGKAISGFLAKMSEYPLVAWNPDPLWDSIRAVMLQKDVIGVEVRGNGNELLLHLGTIEHSDEAMIFHRDVLVEAREFVDEEAVIGEMDSNQKKIGVVTVCLSKQKFYENLENLELTVFVLAVCTFWVSAILAVYSVHYFVGRPLKILIRGVEKVSKGDLETEIHISTNDELERVSSAFNSMVRALRRNLEKRIKDAEKSAQEKNLIILGELSSMLIHEVGNMLNRFSVIEYQLGAEKLSEKGRELLDNFAKELKTLMRFTENVQLFAKKPDLKPRSMELVGFLKGIVASFNFMNPKGLNYVLEFDSDKCVLFADEDAVRQVIVNIITNASDASPKGGTVRIGLKQQSDFVTIEVSDQGAGIPDDVKDKIFTPFFTTKGPKGTGLGLYISRSMVEALGGKIYFESYPGKGTTFFIEFPLMTTS
ncbi:sensor histidine kinase [Dissulfuribacter thermophilus]|uniref:histidine kinase n=1 Tax=Dissulfuribacter thermophilus TaxID=1156395 RepID=A0A1B9F6F1_9BACT|nr:HAMP domain-containing sensor histidine kinase [Dissulfuribacter thermophilus]OCC15517.1 sensor histidine kinase [Dissulfuribacter thermophilus]